MRYHVGATYHGKARSPDCPVAGCTSRRCHRYLENDEHIIFPYCSHHSCSALKDELACFEMTEYDEAYCRGHQAQYPSRAPKASSIYFPSGKAFGTMSYPREIPTVIGIPKQTASYVQSKWQSASPAAINTKPKVQQANLKMPPRKTCKRAGCKLAPRQGRDLCRRHACNMADCSAPALDTSTSDYPYCDAHTCKSGGCAVPKRSTAEACNTHRCHVKACLSIIAKGTYCQHHACRVATCLERRVDGAERCARHTCQHPECPVASGVPGGYCEYFHGCAETDCPGKRAENCELPLLCVQHNAAYHYKRGVEAARGNRADDYERAIEHLTMPGRQDGGFARLRNPVRRNSDLYFDASDELPMVFDTRTSRLAREPEIASLRINRPSVRVSTRHPDSVHPAVHFDMPESPPAPAFRPSTAAQKIKSAVYRGFEQLLARQRAETTEFWDANEPWDIRDEYEDLRDRQQVQRDAFMRVADERMAGAGAEAPPGYEKVRGTRRYPLGSVRLRTAACEEAYTREIYL